MLGAWQLACSLAASLPVYPLRVCLSLPGHLIFGPLSGAAREEGATAAGGGAPTPATLLEGLLWSVTEPADHARLDKQGGPALLRRCAPTFEALYE